MHQFPSGLFFLELAFPKVHTVMACPLKQPSVWVSCHVSIEAQGFLCSPEDEEGCLEMPEDGSSQAFSLSLQLHTLKILCPC